MILVIPGNLLSTLSPWNKNRRATNILKNTGYIYFSLFPSCNTAHFNFFFPFQFLWVWKTKIWSNQVHFSCKVSTSSWARTLRAISGTFSSLLNTSVLADTIHGRSMHDIASKFSFCKGNFSCMYFLHSMYPFNTVDRKVTSFPFCSKASWPFP